MRTTPSPNLSEPPAAPYPATVSAPALDLAGTDSSSVTNLVCAINSVPCTALATKPSATCQLARLNSCVAPFNFNLSAAAGILLWFLLFFLIADICPPYFARCVCRACQDDGCAVCGH